MVAETIVGVTDPGGLSFTVTVTGIQQDEPVNALGSGNTAPDGAGVGTPTAYVRAERSGPGSGRIYLISFSAMNSAGGTCTNTAGLRPAGSGSGIYPHRHRSAV
ncbi:MAG TPA: hypothetical protein VKB72_01680 [Steroidobacteraceae bacterium]|nr:hypothetical protein [Steroidobacteraceae bacterium]